MSIYQMGVLETRFAEIIWAEEPVTSTELVKKADEAFGWKKSTTYTVIRRLCEKGLFQNINGTVTSLVTKDRYATVQSTEFVKESFGGSLPSFLAAFTAGRKLSSEEISELRRLIEEQED